MELQQYSFSISNQNAAGFTNTVGLTNGSTFSRCIPVEELKRLPDRLDCVRKSATTSTLTMALTTI
jgi:hypothetical protein